MNESLRTGAIVVVLAAGFGLVSRFVSGVERSSVVSEDAPTWKAEIVANPPSADDKTIDLAALRGKPVILDFWATWCGPCQAEAPIVNGIAQRYKDKGLVVVGVNTSDEEGLAKVFARKKALTFPIVYDRGNAIARDYHATSLPTLVVISREGKIVAVRRGVTSDSDLDDLVRRVL